jgi:streptogramin lyase
MSLRVLAAAAAIIAGLAAAPAAHAVRYARATQYGFGANDLTAAADGGLFVATDTTIAKAPPNGAPVPLLPRLPDPFKPGRFVRADLLAPGSDGNLWFGFSESNQGNAGLGQLSPLGAFTADEWPVDAGNLTDMVAGPDGSLWFTAAAYGNGDHGKVIRVSTAKKVAVFDDFPVVPGQLSSITPGPDGALWFLDPTHYSSFLGGQDPGPGPRLGRITPAGAVSEYPLPVVPRAITTGPDGNLWASTRGGVMRITPAGVATAFNDPHVHDGGAIVAGPDGSLWIADRGGVTRFGVDGRFQERLDYGFLAAGTPNSEQPILVTRPDVIAATPTAVWAASEDLLVRYGAGGQPTLRITCRYRYATRRTTCSARRGTTGTPAPASTDQAMLTRGGLPIAHGPVRQSTRGAGRGRVLTISGVLTLEGGKAGVGTYTLEDRYSRLRFRVLPTTG